MSTTCAVEFLCGLTRDACIRIAEDFLKYLLFARQQIPWLVVRACFAAVADHCCSAVCSAFEDLLSWWRRRLEANSASEIQDDDGAAVGRSRRTKRCATVCVATVRAALNLLCASTQAFGGGPREEAE
jgi:hypothetical protein